MRITALRIALTAAAALLLLALALNLVVGFVNLLHLFLRQVREGIVGVVVGVVFSGQLPICVFDLFIGRTRGYAQYLIWICHRLKALSLFARLFY